MREAVTQALHKHLTEHAENPMGAAAHLRLEAVSRAVARMVHLKHLLLTHTEQLNDPTARKHICVSSITMPCSTQKSTNLLRSPHAGPISVHTPPRCHQSTPKRHPPQDPPATSTRNTPRPTSRPRVHPAPCSPTWPAQDHPYMNVDTQDLGSPPRQAPPDQEHPPLTQTTIHRPRPPASSPPRQGLRHSPGLVPPTRELDRAHGQSPPGPSHPRQRPPRGDRRPRPLASLPTHARPARLDPPHQVGQGPDTRHRHQPHTSRDHTLTTSPSEEGPPSTPEPPGTVGTVHGTNP